MKNHYETLNLDRNCSAKDIKDSFIELSKKYHPDKNKTSEAHKKFVEVNEAYSVLGKTHTRNIYDESLAFGNHRMVYRSHVTTRSPFDEYAERYAQNLRRNPYDNSGYFNRSKFAGVLVCLVLIFLGSGLQMQAESRRSAYRSQQIARWHKEYRERNKFEKERQKKLNELYAMMDINVDDRSNGEQ